MDGEPTTEALELEEAGRAYASRRGRRMAVQEMNDLVILMGMVSVDKKKADTEGGPEPKRICVEKSNPCSGGLSTPYDPFTPASREQQPPITVGDASASVNNSSSSNSSNNGNDGGLSSGYDIGNSNGRKGSNDSGIGLDIAEMNDSSTEKMKEPWVLPSPADTPVASGLEFALRAVDKRSRASDDGNPPLSKKPRTSSTSPASQDTHSDVATAVSDASSADVSAKAPNNNGFGSAQNAGGLGSSLAASCGGFDDLRCSAWSGDTLGHGGFSSGSSSGSSWGHNSWNSGSSAWGANGGWFSG